MDGDQTLKLLIELGFIGQDKARAAQAALDETAASSADLAKEMGVVTVSAEEAKRILGGLGESAHESGKHVQAHTGEARAMHKVFHELNQLVPGLGTALKIAFHPGSIGIVGTLAAFEALKSVIEDMRAIDEIKVADFAGSKEAVEAVRDAYEKARVAAQLFVDEQRRLDHAGIGADEVAKRKIESYKSLAAAQTEYNNAQKTLSETTVDEQEKAGVITHQQAIEKKYALDVEYARRKLLLEAQINAAELAAKQQQLDTEKAQLEKAKQDQGTDEANAASTAAAKARHDKQIETAKKNLESAQKTLEELGKSKGNWVSSEVNDETAGRLEEYYKKYVGGNATRHSDMFLALQNAKGANAGFNAANADVAMQYFMAHTIGNQSGPEEFAKYDDAKQQLASAKSQVFQLEKTQYQVDLNAERGRKQLDATEDIIRKTSASVDKLARELPQTKADNQAKLNNDAAVENLNLRNAAVKLGLPDPGNTFIATGQPVMSAAQPGTAGDRSWHYNYGPDAATAPAGRPGISNQEARGRAQNDFNEAHHIKQLLESGSRVSVAQQDQVRLIAEHMTGHAVRSQDLLKTLQQIFADQKHRDAALQRDVEQLKQKASASRG